MITDWKLLIERLKSFKPDEKRYALAQLLKNNLDLLCEFIGYKDINNPFHRWLISEIEKDESNKIYLLPRGHLKSSLVTIAETIRQILINPHVRIAIASHTFSVAKTFLGEIRAILERNETLKAVFPSVIHDNPTKDSPLWTQSQIQVKRFKPIKEPTVTAFGIDSIPVGMHFDRLICDDLVTANSVTTADQIKKTKDNFRYLTPLLTKVGHKAIVGTRYAYNDLYSELENNSDYIVIKQPCFDRQGEPVFSEHFSKESLNAMRSEMGPYIFSCQMLLNPIEDDEATFKRAWLRYYDKLPVGDLNYFLSLDPAISESVDADYSAFVVAAVDCEHDIFVCEAIRDRLNPSEIIDLLFKLNKKYPILTNSIETISYQKALMHFIDQRIASGELPINIQPIASRKHSKEIRIRGLVPYFNRSKIYIKDSMTDLVDELVHFPRAPHDDLIDALADIPSILFAPSDTTHDEYYQSLSSVRRQQATDSVTGY